MKRMRPDSRNAVPGYVRSRTPPPADILVSDGAIKIGNVAIKVIHTPGHTPGGMCLYIDGMVFTGDTLFVGSVGRTDFPGGSYAELESSIRTRLYTLPGDTVVFPGHNYGMYAILHHRA